MIICTRIIHPALDTLLALTLGAATSISTWTVTASWSAVSVTVPHTGLMQLVQGNHQHPQPLREEVIQQVKLDLTARELPTKGLQPGVFADVVQGVKTDKRRKAYKTLTLVGELQATKSNGKRFIAHATYNLDDNRGVKHLLDDLKTWRGTNAIPDIGNFDPEAEFYGKPFLCDPIFGDEKGSKVIRLHGFRPDPEKGVTVSLGFVRAQDRPQAATAAHTSPQGEAQQPASAPTAA
jgi:hypothetical protein